ncbi:MurR/RpiR family transcriptional regulator [Streptococcus uberis]|uniref:MurR/RpiR family transcriptional regulator n=1 Tax=Streptococcus uberis TaxID=1349 RepID=UPI000DFE7638|nr:MurR/RpiR family transcriptional regulator [Streptococcus uberis]MCK1206736.1 MurR/RpiR family transcriptional regulator [Streptococcus uberis]SUO91215.1 rpiR-family regulatory protein [Streptococcus uberis]
MLEDIQLLAQQKQSSKAAIAETILVHLNSIEQLSLEDLARLSFTSKSSVVRFAQSLGFKGWVDFLPALLSERIYADAHYSNIDHSLPFNQDDSIKAIIQKIATIEKESIQDTADQLSQEELEKASQQLAKAKRIVVFGLSPNDYLAHLFKRKMLTLGKNIEIAHSSEFGLTAASLSQDDVAILISYSGISEKNDTLRHLPLLEKNKVFRIGLSSQNGHYLKEHSNAFFQICTREDKHKKIGNFSTEESILFILNTLYAVYFKADYMKNYIRKLNLSQALENDR